MTEVRMWKTLGLALIGGAVVAVLIAAVKFGLRPENTIMLGLDMGAAFIGMAGAAARIAGRVMEATPGNTAATSKALRVAGLVIGLVGAAIAATAVARAGLGAPTVNQLWLGMAGSSLTLVGIMGFLAHRVLERSAAGQTKVAAAS